MPRRPAARGFRTKATQSPPGNDGGPWHPAVPLPPNNLDPRPHAECRAEAVQSEGDVADILSSRDAPLAFSLAAPARQAEAAAQPGPALRLDEEPEAGAPAVPPRVGEKRSKLEEIMAKVGHQGAGVGPLGTTLAALPGGGVLRPWPPTDVPHPPGKCAGHAGQAARPHQARRHGDWREQDSTTVRGAKDGALGVRRHHCQDHEPRPEVGGLLQAKGCRHSRHRRLRCRDRAAGFRCAWGLFACACA